MYDSKLFLSHTVQIEYNFLSLRKGNALKAANNEIDQDIALSHLLLEGNTSVKRGGEGGGRIYGPKQKRRVKRC